MRTTLGSIVEGRCPGHRPAPKNLGFLKTIVMMNLVVGVAVLATSHRMSLCMHYACNSAKQSRAKRATPRRRQRPDRPKKDQERKPQNQKEGRRGWVRIRDMKHPRIHTPPQTRPSAKSPWPLPGRSVVVRYVAIAPLSGSALHILTLHFCKCILPSRGIVVANTLQHSCVALWPTWSSQTPIP